jgi:hypothetical protein
MELNEIVGGILMLLGIGFIVLSLCIWILYLRIKNRVDSMIEKVITDAESNLIGLDIELDNGSYFCYNSRDKQFICRGNTVVEVRQAFQARFPDKTAYLAGGDPRVVAEFKTELLKLGTNEISSSQ